VVSEPLCAGARSDKVKVAVFWAIALMMAVSTSETSVKFYQTTWRNKPEDSHLHTRRRENLKSHLPIRRSFQALHTKFLAHPFQGVAFTKLKPGFQAREQVFRNRTTQA
jgi:hypothetical protein